MVSQLLEYKSIPFSKSESSPQTHIFVVVESMKLILAQTWGLNKKKKFWHDFEKRRFTIVLELCVTQKRSNKQEKKKKFLGLQSFVLHVTMYLDKSLWTFFFWRTSNFVHVDWFLSLLCTFFPQILICRCTTTNVVKCSLVCHWPLHYISILLGPNFKSPP